MRVLSQNGYDDCIFSFGLNGIGHTQLAYLSLARLCDMEPRRSASSAALVDEPGSDSQKPPGPSVALG